jgi:hypothetical protein
MEYTIIQDNNLHNFIIKVNEAIKEGWTPVGGVAFGGFIYSQAMIRNIKPQD